MAKLITINGESATRAGWARKLNVTRGAISFRQKKFGETAEVAVKHFYFQKLAREGQSLTLANLKFYNDIYIKDAMRTISYALPQLVGEVAGAGRILSRVVADLEDVARMTETVIKELEANKVEGN